MDSVSLPRLSKTLLRQPRAAASRLESGPPPGVWDFEEKILQFGSGRFLRAFLGDIFDQANQADLLRGRTVIVQSTSAHTADRLNQQDGLYTLCLQGLRNGESRQSYRMLSSNSRALGANREWGKVLEVARSPHLELIVSNTTEVGIVLDPEDSLKADPPRSYPGKLLAVLYERFLHFQGSVDRGVVVIPCELITDNGTRLREIVLELARSRQLGDEFLDWLIAANPFCNSLVDRIVTGAPPREDLHSLWQQLGYRDDLLTLGEHYALWAIEGDEAVQRRLSFAAADPHVIIAPDITPYRERKLRILNGTHTIATPIAFLNGNDTVLQSMQDPLISGFIERVMREEIAPTLQVDRPSVNAFIEEVLGRFRNPFLKHKLLDISFQSTSKLRLRVIPTLERHYEAGGGVPDCLCLGFASYLLFMRGVPAEGKTMAGSRQGRPYPIQDDFAEYFQQQWSRVDVSDSDQVSALVGRVCADVRLWGQDLSRFPGFAQRVADCVSQPTQQLHRALRNS